MAAPPPGMPPPAPGYYPPPPPLPPSRPLGVTILAILTILLGIGLLLLGLVIGVLGLVGAMLAPELGGLVLIALIGGVLLFIVGIMMIAAGFGLLRLRMWAWWLAIIAFALGTVSSIMSASYFSAAILVLLIIYLILVRKHFGAPRPAGM